MPEELDASSPLNLTRDELYSSAWGKVRDYCEQRLETLRILNDGDHDTSVTARLRGEIRAYKNLLEFGKPPPAISDTDA